MAQFLKIPSFIAGRKIVDATQGTPTTEFLRQLNDTLVNVRSAVNSLAQVQTDILASLEQAGIALTTAQGIAANQILAASYVDPTQILSAEIDPTASTKTKITVANHSRVYPNGSPASVSVTGGSLSGLEMQTLYLLYYDDPSRAGGVVTYHATIDPAAAVQKNDRHCVGSIITPSTAFPDPTDGGGTTGSGVPFREDGYYGDGIIP